MSASSFPFSEALVQIIPMLESFEEVKIYNISEVSIVIDKSQELPTFIAKSYPQQTN